MIQKQTVYLPVNGDYLTAVCHFENTDWCHHETVQPKEGYFFTPEQLNEYTQSVIKQALETAAENAKIKEDELETESYTKADEFAQGKSYSYTTDMDGCLIGVDTFEIDKKSITNTFEETFKKFEI